VSSCGTLGVSPIITAVTYHKEEKRKKRTRELVHFSKEAENLIGLLGQRVMLIEKFFILSAYMAFLSIL